MPSVSEGAHLEASSSNLLPWVFFTFAGY